MNYRIIYKDELYHHGVKGMKWGVRKQPERSGGTKSRKGMSTAKKVAIGVSVAAAVGGVAYIAVTKRNNRLAQTAVQRALKVRGGSPIKASNIKRGPTRAVLKYHTSSNGLGTDAAAVSIAGTRTPKLTGHSKYRMTKTGQAYYHRNQHAQKMDSIVRENARRTRSRGDKDWFFDDPELGKQHRYHKDEYNRLNRIATSRWNDGHTDLVRLDPVNRLRRQRGPKALRRH